MSFQSDLPLLNPITFPSPHDIKVGNQSLRFLEPIGWIGGPDIGVLTTIRVFCGFSKAS